VHEEQATDLARLFGVLMLLPPSPISVTVAVEDLSPRGLLGLTEFDEDHIVLTLDDDLGYRLAVAVLLHEWAHVLSWDAPDESGRHGPSWGVAYAWVYRCFAERPIVTRAIPFPTGPPESP